MDQLKTADVLLQEESDRHDILLFVETSHWYQSLAVQDSKDLKVVLTSMNTRLNGSKVRLDGLLLLSSIVAQASPQVFDENYQHWIQHLKKITLHDADERIRCLAIRIFGEIVQIASKYPEHHRVLAANVSSQFIVQLLDMDENCDLTVAHGLSSMLKFFPGPCRQHSIGIQKRILEMLSVKNLEIVEVASTCMSLLPFISGGDRGKSHSTAWSELYAKFCRTMYWELNTLYEGLEVDQQMSLELNEQILFPLTLENGDAASVFLNSYRRVISIFLCLQKLLKNGDAVLLTVPVEEILNLIYRILKINGKTLASRKSHDSQVALLNAVLPIIHGEALTLLEQLFLSCRKHMLLHDQKILTFIHQTLLWTSAAQHGNETKCTLSKLRGVAFRVLITWLRVAGSSTDFSHLGDAIVHQLMKDVFLEEKQSTETATNSNANYSKAKRPKLEAFLTVQQKNVNLMDNDTPLLALNALNIILYTAHEDLRIATLKAIETSVLALLLKLQHGFNDQLATSHYGGDAGCRAALFKLLLAVVVTPSLTTHVLLSKSIHIFSLGQMDVNPEICQVCYQGLAVCRAIIEPVRRSLPVHVVDTATLPPDDVEMCMEITDIERLDQLQQEAVCEPVGSVLTNGLRNSPASKSQLPHTSKEVADVVSDDDVSLIHVSDDDDCVKPVPMKSDGPEREGSRVVAAANFAEIILEESPPKKVLQPSAAKALKSSPKDLRKSSPEVSLKTEHLSSGQTSSAEVPAVPIVISSNPGIETDVDKLPRSKSDEQAPMDTCSGPVRNESQSTQVMLSSFINSQPDDNDVGDDKSHD